jgi:regulator of sigma E protease
MAGGAAEHSGLRKGDVVRTIGATAIVDGQQLREVIRASGRRRQAAHPPGSSSAPASRSRSVTPEVREEGGAKVGRIGAYVGAPPEMVTVRHGPVDGLWRAWCAPGRCRR